MTGDPDNFFTPLVIGPGLTLEERAALISDAINLTTPAKPPHDFNYKAGCIGEYNAFKRHFSAIYNDVATKFKSVSLSLLFSEAMKLEQKMEGVGMDADSGDEKPLRQSLDGLRDQIAREKALLAEVNAPNARLTEIYTVLYAAEKKMPVMQFSVLHETSEILRLLEHHRDMAHWNRHHARIGAMLDKVEFVLDAIGSYQQSEQEKENLRGHLKTVLATDVAVAAPAVAHFSRKPQVQP